MTHDFFFFCGLMDAEGCFSTPGSKSIWGGKTINVTLKMTDFDTVDWSSKNFGGNRVFEMKPKSPKHLLQYNLGWSGKNAKIISKRLAPYLSDRRRGRIESLIEEDIEPMWNHLSEEEQLAWIAGYVEGEGCFYLLRDLRKPGKDGKMKSWPSFKLSSTDEDAVERVSSILDLKVSVEHSPSRVKTGRKPLYVVRSSKREVVHRIGYTLQPFMFSRRLGKMAELDIISI